MQGENERAGKKKLNENTYDISSIKRVTKTFLEVSRCSGAKQWQRMNKKSVLHVQSFLLIRPIVVFHRSPALLSRFYIWFEQAINIIESFAFRPWLNLYIIYIYH